MQNQLTTVGAHIDDFRFCPHHPNATLSEYRKFCVCRKPSPGMIRDLLRIWNVIPEKSIFIGDKNTDMQAAALAGIKGYLFKQQNLQSMLKRILIA
jgi:D-glycero-D-manno-heptose 1,7-bisphosphate phosphatase